MSRLSRSYSESGVYHVMFRGVNYQDLFEEKQDYIKLKEIIATIKKEMKFEIYAYCFMSNHVHIVMKECKSRDISLIMKRILTRYARWYNIKYGRSGALIANRYKSMPVEIDEYFLQLIRYVHQNPLKAGMVDDIKDYPYSSYNEYKSNPIITDIDFVLSMMSAKEFEDFHLKLEEMNFEVSDRTKKTDEAMILKIRTDFGIDMPKEISKLEKSKRNEILHTLKQDYPARQIQRITGVSRGIISRL